MQAKQRTTPPQVSAPVPPKPAARCIQRAQVAQEVERAIEEGETRAVDPGGTLRFTALAAGCLAVVALFQGGGGAGVHMALKIDKDEQWNNFLNAIAGHEITTVYLYSDMLGERQGWHVKYHLNEDVMIQGPDGSQPPRAGGEVDINEGWIADEGLAKEWFKTALSAQRVILTRTNKTVEHQCP
ncbi:MAG TPA: hypothetical protein VF756_12280 [Thermoanaerobaculia bacterium]